jgi:hypothetical protein
MFNKYLFIAISVLVSFSFPLKSVQVSGKVLKIFQGLGDLHFSLVTETDIGQKVTKFSSSLDVLASWDLPRNIEWLSNDGHENGLVFVSLLTEEDTVTKIRGSLQMLNMKSGMICDLKLVVKNERFGTWIGKNNRYLFGGRLFNCDGEKVVSVRVSGAPYNVVSSDERYSAQFLIKRADSHIAGSVTVEDLTNNDMLNVATFRMADSLGMLMDFSKDSRYLYYRAGDSPALYDLKELRGLGIPDIKYQLPAFVDAYLDGDRNFFFHDDQSIVLVGRKTFEVEDVVPNPFGDIAMKICSADDIHLSGFLYETRKGTRHYLKAFTVTAKGLEPKNKTWDLPVNSIWVTLDGKKCKAVYYDNNALNLFEMKLN